VLITFSLSGGHFLFAGVRGFEMGLGLLGLGLIMAGFLFDSAMTALSERGRNKVILEILRHNSSRALAVEIDRTLVSGEALLDAFLTKETFRRQDDYNQGWMDLAMEGSHQKESNLQEDEEETGTNDQNQEQEQNQDQPDAPLNRDENEDEDQDPSSFSEVASMNEPNLNDSVNPNEAEPVDQISNLDLDQLGGNTGPLPPLPQETQVQISALPDSTDLSEGFDFVTSGGMEASLTDLDLDAVNLPKSEN
jgi:hypothetical protein